jgi:hypothetical protein
MSCRDAIIACIYGLSDNCADGVECHNWQPVLQSQPQACCDCGHLRSAGKDKTCIPQ